MNQQKLKERSIIIPQIDVRLIVLDIMVYHFLATWKKAHSYLKGPINSFKNSDNTWKIQLSLSKSSFDHLIRQKNNRKFIWNVRGIWSYAL